jgi:hypothetical protein
MVLEALHKETNMYSEHIHINFFDREPGFEGIAMMVMAQRKMCIQSTVGPVVLPQRRYPIVSIERSLSAQFPWAQTAELFGKVYGTWTTYRQPGTPRLAWKRPQS